MTAADHLKTIRERVEAATEGPWAWSEEQDGWGDCGPNLDGPTDEVIGSWGHDANGIFVGTADAEFIAHARTDLPRLLDAVEAALGVRGPTSNECRANHYADGYRNALADVRKAITTALEGK